MLSEFLWKVLEAAGFLRSEIITDFEKLKISEPTLQDAINRLQDKIFLRLQPLLDVDTAVAMVKRIGAELASGTPGYDKDHWTVA